MRLALSLLVAVMSTWGCVSTTYQSRFDTSAPGRGFRYVMVSADIADLELRRETEELFVAELGSRGIRAVPSLSALFLGRYSIEEAELALAGSNVDSVLSIRPAKSGTSYGWIPPTSTTNASATVYGKTIIGSATTTTTGGYLVASEWANFDASFYDLAAHRAIWQARFKSQYGTKDEMLLDVAKMAAKVLTKERIVR